MKRGKISVKGVKKKYGNSLLFRAYILLLSLCPVMEDAISSEVGALIHIRRFKLTDLGRVYEIECKSFKDPYHVLFLLNLYELYHDTFYVAEKNGIVVGYVISRKVNTSGHILAIAVDPNHRRQGIGSILMEVVTDKLRREGAEEIWLEVRVSNTGAIQFYKKLGFEKKGYIPHYYSDGEDAIILKKYLTI
jgi:ribosomal-protein-alanine N-acetyltransferase